MGELNQSAADCAEFAAVNNNYRSGVIVLFDDSQDRELEKCFETEEQERERVLKPDSRKRYGGVTYDRRYVPPGPNIGVVIRESEIATSTDLTRKFVIINTSIIFDKTIDSGLPPEIRLQNALMHEAGHSIGLEHSLINFPQVDGLDRPIMSPDWSKRTTLHPDDIAGVSDLYPSTSFSERYGWISGTVMRSGRRPQPMANVNVVAKEVSSGEQFGFITRNKSVDGDETWTGTFKLAVPMGEYSLRILPVPTDVHLMQDQPDPNHPQFIGFTYSPSEGKPKMFSVRPNQVADAGRIFVR